MKDKILSLLNVLNFIPLNSCLLVEDPKQENYNELFKAVKELIDEGIIRYRNCEGLAIELNK